RRAGAEGEREQEGRAQHAILRAAVCAPPRPCVEPAASNLGMWTTMPQQLSGAAILAFVFAVVAFFVNPLLGFFLALGAVLLGIIGMLRAISPRTRGGLMSLAAIVLGVLGMVVKIIDGALHLLF